MKYLAILLALFMLAGTGTAYANGGGEGDNTNCQGQGNPNSPCDPDDDDDSDGHDHDDHEHGGGGSNGGSGGTGGDGGNGGDGGAGGEGGSVVVGDVTVGGGEGGSVGDTSATGGSVGDTSATGGSVGDTTAEGGDATGGSANVEVVVEGDTYQAADIPVNSAPISFAAICSSGMGGTGSKISLSFAVTSDVCTALMMADAYQAVGEPDEVTYWLKRAAKHARWKGNVGLFRTVITLGIL